MERESMDYNQTPLTEDDRPTIMAYEPGSTMKIFSLSSMLDAGAITADDIFHCNGYYEKILPSGEDIKIYRQEFIDGPPYYG